MVSCAIRKESCELSEGAQRLGPTSSRGTASWANFIMASSPPLQWLADEVVQKDLRRRHGLCCKEHASSDALQCPARRRLVHPGLELIRVRLVLPQDPQEGETGFKRSQRLHLSSAGCSQHARSSHRRAVSCKR